jgi:hypothetical protein
VCVCVRSSVEWLKKHYKTFAAVTSILQWLNNRTAMRLVELDVSHSEELFTAGESLECLELDE